MCSFHIHVMQQLLTLSGPYFEKFALHKVNATSTDSNSKSSSLETFKANGILTKSTGIMSPIF